MYHAVPTCENWFGPFWLNMHDVRYIEYHLFLNPNNQKVVSKTEIKLVSLLIFATIILDHSLSVYKSKV